MNDVITARPPVGDGLTYLTIAEAAGLLAAKRLSPVELVRAHLERIAACDRRIFSYITVAAELALAQARNAEREIMRGEYRGALHGIPYSLKDIFYTRGVRTTAGSRLYWNWVPDADATVHARLRAVGAVLLGKNNTWEFGTGTGEVCEDLPFPVARNPWNTAYYTGGSSSGTGAAVAAGLAMFGLGSDTGSSVRIPSAANGLFGLKPTYGRVSRAGILPNSFSFDAVGPITRTVRDSAQVMAVIAGRDAADSTSEDRPVPDYTAGLEQGVRGLRIGIVRRFYRQDVAAHPDVVAGIEAAADVLRGLGAQIVGVDLPFTTAECRLIVATVGAAESLSAHEADFRSRHGEMGKALREKFMAALAISAVDFVKASRWRRQLAIRADAIIQQCDAVLCVGPFQPVPRLEHKDAVISFGMGAATCCFNVTGHPAAAICVGFDGAGLPLSMQIIGKYWDEAAVLRVAAAYERATQWHRRRPPLSAVDRQEAGP
jgi:aspartyl-tRNA(Asn)/glutamyl-tRNA(Gln) amidotransferase subunit A